MPNYLSLWRSKIKKSNKSPEFRGIIRVEKPLEVGVYETALFAKVSKKGNPIFSGEIVQKVEFQKPVPHFQEKDNDPEPDNDF